MVYPLPTLATVAKLPATGKVGSGDGLMIARIRGDGEGVLVWGKWTMQGDEVKFQDHPRQGCNKLH